MTEQWKPNIAYKTKGTKIEYEGVEYELIQPHTSQMGWEPTQTPALWKSCHKISKPNSPQGFNQQNQPSFHGYNTGGYNSGGQTTTNSNPIPYKWEPYTGFMPQNAIGISNSLGRTFFVARSNIKGGVHPGYSDPTNNRCFVSFGGKEYICEKFEVLICEPNRYQWVQCSDPKKINGNPIISGNESDGTPLYSCKCYRDSIPYFGKTSSKATCAYYAYNGKEHRVNNFEVLTFN